MPPDQDAEIKWADDPPKETLKAGPLKGLDVSDIPDAKLPSLKDIYSSVSDGSPDAAAKQISLVQKTGMNPLFVGANPDAAQAAAQSLSDKAWDDIAQRHPVSTRFMSELQNMAVVHDHIGNVVDHESLIQHASHVMDYLTTQAALGPLEEERAFTQFRIMSGQGLVGTSFQSASALRTGPYVASLFGIDANDPKERLKQLDASIGVLQGQLPKDIGFGAKIGGLAVNLLPMMAGDLAYSGAGAAVGSLIEPGGGSVAGAVAGNKLYSFQFSVGAMRQSLSEIKDENGKPILDDNTINAYALMGGTFASYGTAVMLKAGLELVPGGQKVMASFTKEAGKAALESPMSFRKALGEFVWNRVKGGAKMGAGMAEFTAAQSAATEAAKKTSGQPFKYDIGQDVSNTLGAGRDGFLVGLLFGLANAPWADEFKQARRTEAEQQFYEAMGKTAKASKLLKRLPEAHQALLKDLTAGSPVENVLVTTEGWDRVFQDARIDPEAAAQQLDLGLAYEEAKKTGSPMKVPLATWINKLVGTPHYDALAPDIKFTPDGLTMRELSAKREAQNEQLKLQIDAAAPEIKKLVEKDASSERIRQDWIERFSAAYKPWGMKDEQRMKHVERAAEYALNQDASWALMQKVSLEEAHRQAPPFGYSDNLTGAGQVKTVVLSDADARKMNFEAIQQWRADVSAAKQKGVEPPEAPVMLSAGDSVRMATGEDSSLEQAAGQGGERAGLAEQGKPSRTPVTPATTPARRPPLSSDPSSYPKSITENAGNFNALFGEQPLEGTAEILRGQLRNIAGSHGLDVNQAADKRREELDTLTHPLWIKGFKDIVKNENPLVRNRALDSIEREVHYDLLLGRTPDPKLFEAHEAIRQTFPEAEKPGLIQRAAGFVKGLFGGQPQQEQLYQGEAANGFEAWFSGSKVVDRKGNPLVVYHGTGNAEGIVEKGFSTDFVNKGNDQLGMGFYFSNRQQTASGYTESLLEPELEKIGGEKSPGVLPVYLSIKNPIILKPGQYIRDVLPKLSAGETKKLLMKAPHIKDPEGPLSNWGDIEHEGFDKVLQSAIDAYSNGDIMSMGNDMFAGESKAFLKAVKSVLGYDGVVSEFKGGEKHFVAWFPEQIKSAIGNSGAYDPTVASILFQDAGGEPAPTFYSKMARDIEAKLQNKSTPEQVKALLRDAKEDEVKWSGILDYLQGKSKIDKADLLKFLAGNQVQIKEVHLGPPQPKEEKALAVAEPNLPATTGAHEHQQMTPEEIEERRDELEGRVEQEIETRYEAARDEAFDDELQNHEPDFYTDEIEEEEEEDPDELSGEELKERGYPQPDGRPTKINPAETQVKTHRYSGEFEKRQVYGIETHVPGVVITPAHESGTKFSEDRFTVTHEPTGISFGQGSTGAALEEAWRVVDELAKTGVNFAEPDPDKFITYGENGSAEKIKEAIKNGLASYKADSPEPKVVTKKKWAVFLNGSRLAHADSYETEDEANDVAQEHNNDDAEQAAREARDNVDRDEIENEVREEMSDEFDALGEGREAPGSPKENYPKTQFSGYQTPGGSNYREVLLTLPPLPPIEEKSPQGNVLRTDQPAFNSGHFSQPNIFAHVRFSDRVDADGKKVLFIDEFQSDWANKGKSEGYVDPEAQKKKAELQKQYNDLQQQVNNISITLNDIEHRLIAQISSEPDFKFEPTLSLPVGYKAIRVAGSDRRQEYWKIVRADEDASAHPFSTGNSEKDAISSYISGVDADRWSAMGSSDMVAKRRARLAELKAADPQITELQKKFDDINSKQNALREQSAAIKAGNIPDFPFKKNWIEIAAKRMLRYAAEHGYDKMAWTPGDVQAERWNLSQRVDALHYKKTKDGEYSIWATKVGGGRVEVGVHPAARLADVVGKEIGDKIIAGEGQLTEYGVKEAPIDPGYFQVFDRATGEVSGTYQHETAQAQALEQNKANDGRKTIKGENLNVGGQGKKKAYDQIVPSFLNKFGKKFGAKVEPATLQANSGGDKSSHPIASAVARGEKPVHSIEITPELKRAAIKEGFPLFQGEGEKRGSYDPVENFARLGPKANASTIIHELNHGYLQRLFNTVKNGDATQELLEHWKPMADHLGVTADQEKLTTEQHEKFARLSEAHLMEGKAPSEALRPVFEDFSKWLTKIYGTVRGLNVELTPETRAFFDRMLASQQEIDQAQNTVGYNPNETAGISGGDPQLQAKVRTLQDRAHDEAVETLWRDQVKELKEDAKNFLDKERARLTEAADTAVAGLPVYQAQDDLRKKMGAKGDISKASTFSDKTVVKAAESFLSDKAFPSDLAADFEAVAEVHGFQDGKDLATHIVQADLAGGAAAEIKKKVDEGMLPYADLRNTDAIKQRALDAIHTERMGEVLALEQQILEQLQEQKQTGAELAGRRRQSARIAAQDAKKQAREMLANKPYREAMQFKPYYTAERDAAVRVSKALANGDYAKAAKAKGEQMLNHALASEAQRNAKEITKDLNFFKRFAKRDGDLLKMPYAFTFQIDRLLGDRGFSFPELGNQSALLEIAKTMEANKSTPDQIANSTSFMRGDDGKWRRERLRDFVDRVNENYYALQLPESILEPDRKLSQGGGGISMGELRDLREAVGTIYGIGRSFDRFFGDFTTASIKEAGAELAASVQDHQGKPYAGQLAPGHDPSKIKELLDRIKSLPDNYLNDQKTLYTICDILDGGDPNGPAKRFFYRPLERAQSNKESRRARYVEQINEIMARHYTPAELADHKNQWHTFDFFQGGPRRFNKAEITQMARNWGNEGNRDRVMNGFNLDEEQVNHIFQKVMLKKDFDANQDIFDHLQTYWPDIVALEMKINGWEPEQVARAPIRTHWKTYEGGYFPLAYDFDKSLDAYRNAEEKNELYKKLSPAKAHTDKGHTKQRVNSLNRPVRLEADVLINHLENVNHDLAFREAVIDMNRLLRLPDVRSSITNAIGQDGLKTIEDHLKAVASDQSDFVDGAAKALRWFRFKATMATLAIRPAIFPLRFGGDVINAISELGPTGFLSSVKNFWAGDGTRAFVDGKSELMKNRSETRERDIYDVSRSFDLNESGFMKAFHQYAFAADTFADQIVAYPLWTTIYKKALASGQNERDAVSLANESIVRSFGSGRKLDQIEAQRGGEFQKATTMFMSWNTMMFNRWLRATGIAGGQFRNDETGAAAATLISAMVFTFILPGIYETITREAMRNVTTQTYEDPEDKKRRLVARALEAPFGGMWIARDIAPIIMPAVVRREESLRLGEPIDQIKRTERRKDFKASPMEDALGTLLETVDADDKQLPKLSAKSASYLTGTPQTVVNWVFNYLDWLEKNGEATWRDFLGTPRVKK